MTENVNVRALVLDTLLEVTEEGEFGHIAVRNTLKKYGRLEKKERAFYTRVSFGTIERMIEIDYIIDLFSKTKVKKMKPAVRAVLRSGTYQLLFMDAVPDSAVCDESVKLVKKRGFAGLAGFVNGVLRNIARNKERLAYPDEASDPVNYLSVRFSMPEWIVKRFLAEYGAADAETILSGLLSERPTSVRCNLSKNTPKELRAALEKEGVSVKEAPYLPYAFEISGYDALERLETFQEGRFFVQDVSSMLAVETASPGGADLVMDVCAAPGGKSLHAAERLSGGRVLAFDLTEAKTALIRENIARCGADNITAAVRDATVPYGEDAQKADVVLADLPCSGLGVVARKPDIKYRISGRDIKELASLQRRILAAVQTYVKPGGILLYSTCTLTREEDEDNREWFLGNFPFEPVPLDGCLPGELCGENAQKGYVKLLPGIHGTDGFFIAKFRRTPA